MRQVLRTVFIIGLIVLESPFSAIGQQNFLPGFAGLMCCSQSDPGIYAVAYGWGMDVRKVADRNGKIHSFPNGDALHLKAPSLSVTVVTNTKILGGNYSYSVTGAVCNSRLEIPSIVTASESQPYGITSTYIQPISLGWSTSWADFIAGYAVYLPTGKWTWRSRNNYGLGMWTQEINVGTTIYLNRNKNIHFSIEANYDINSKKRGVSYRTGWPLTLQGGMGVNYGNQDKLLSGWFGVAGFAQWTTVRTKYNSDLGPIDGSYAHIYGLGPEFVAFKGALAFRYLIEFRGKSNYVGPIWCVTLTIPIKKF
ncbi:MAG: hypothetical protein J7604_24125 [Sporocytophaga sp.]|uniref:transporter n=1 Tax=Sporocytophaga sp. TaxID=2231183 RepID=UPI001B0E2AE4|nr:transporter [Sporocytophaga sp.]MBO9703324.1 hypothetical protein [Sporocytophaga sp.]